jgi:aminopeptidase
MEWADVYYGLRGAYNLHIHDEIDAGRLARNQAAMGHISTLRWQKTRWCLVRVPNAAFAFQAGVDLESLEEMFFAGCLLDWEAVSRRWPRAHGAGPCLSSVWRRQPIGHPLGYRQRHPQ